MFMRDLCHIEWLNRCEFISIWGFLCETEPNTNCFHVQDVEGGVARAGYWDVMREFIRRWGSGGYAFPEWTVELLPGSTYVDHETASRDNGEFLGY